MADRLPQVVQIGTIRRRHGGLPGDLAAYDRDGRRASVHAEDMQAIRNRMEEIQARIRERAAARKPLARPGDAPGRGAAAGREVNADRVEEIRQSVTDEAVHASA